jgi:hypothetical protein
MRKASTRKLRAGVLTYNVTLVPSEAYVLLANPEICGEAPLVILHASVPGNLFSATTQLASLPYGPGKVTSFAGTGLCGFDFGFGWVVAWARAAGVLLQAVSRRARRARRAAGRPIRRRELVRVRTATP